MIHTMKMTTKNHLYRLLSSGVLLAAVMPAIAQYDQNINVEGKYVPEFIDRDRIGLFPKQLKFPPQKSELAYSLTGVNADFAPMLVPLQATGWNTTREYSANRGYLDLGMGSWLNSTLSAGYRFVDDRNTVFGVRLQHNSTSLWNPDVDARLKDAKRWRYDESLGIYASHIFEGLGSLDAALDYHLGNFNYYGFSPYFIPDGNSGSQAGVPVPTIAAGSDLTPPTQTLNDIAFRFAWHSPASREALTWYAGASIRYFGYRSFYYYPTVNDVTSGPDRVQGSRETVTSLCAGINFPTAYKSAIGLDVDGSLVTYSDRDSYSSALSHNVFGYLPGNPDNYGLLNLTPYYRFNTSGLDIRIGARIDLAFNAGVENDRYSTFHIAPSVKLDYNAGPVAFYLYANGGSRLNTLAGNYEYDYYQNPAVYSTRPVYSPVDAKLGVTFGPFSGFHAGIDVSYRISRGEYNGGWFMPWLNLNSFEPGAIGLPSEVEGRKLMYDFSPDVRIDMKGLSLGLNLGYDAGRYFSIDANAHYQRQNGETGYFNGYDRPEWIAEVSAVSNPWNTLKFKLGYQLRAMRMMCAPAYYVDSTPLNGLSLIGYRLPNKSMLSLGVSYGITENFDVWIQADNLLCRKTLYLPGLPEPGLCMAAGIGVRF